jgi:glycosidase
LDYIQSLNVDTLWLMPIYPSPSVHGYDVTDFMAVNPEYGTLEDLQELVESAHSAGLKVLLDFVPSHLSDQNPIFQDAYQNPDSPYSEWFVWTNDAHTRYAGFADLREMPRFNHYNPEVVDYLSEAALYWLDLDGDGDYSDGVDGFRIDNATFPPQEFFYEFRQRIKSNNPEALLLGETWVNSPSDLSRYFEDQFDALFDFPLYALLQGNQNLNEDGLLAGKTSPALLSVLLNEQNNRYPPEGISVRFFSNHDTNRTATEINGHPARLKLTPALVGILPGVPMVYYGEEIGMFGQKGGPPSWDNYRREPMDWYAAEAGDGQTTWFMPDDRWNKAQDGISVQEQEEAADSLLNAYRHILALRNERPVLTSGETIVLDLQVESPGPWGVLRRGVGTSIVGIFNFSDSIQVVKISDFPFSSASPVDLLTGAELPAVEAGETYELRLDPASAYWISPSP